MSTTRSMSNGIDVQTALAFALADFGLPNEFVEKTHAIVRRQLDDEAREPRKKP